LSKIISRVEDDNDCGCEYGKNTYNNEEFYKGEGTGIVYRRPYTGIRKILL
jgi:hypothetical protein